MTSYGITFVTAWLVISACVLGIIICVRMLLDQ